MIRSLINNTTETIQFLRKNDLLKGILYCEISENLLHKVKYKRNIDGIAFRYWTSMDIALFKLETTNFFVTVIDAPGNKEYIKNMITRTSHADYAMLVVTITNVARTSRR